jgi:hypothetical protein
MKQPPKLTEFAEAVLYALRVIYKRQIKYGKVIRSKDLEEEEKILMLQRQDSYKFVQTD